MAIERREQRHHLDEYPGRDRERDYDERSLSEERKAEYAGLRHDRAAGFGRHHDSAAYDLETPRSLAAEHRERFLRRSAGSEAPTRYMRDWRERDRWSEDWSGPHAGRGPRGYKRSDERILEDVCDRLTSHPSIDATDIDVKISDGDVTLSGWVESRAIKHLTEAMVETVSGVREVQNHLRVAAVNNDPPHPAPERAAPPIEPKRRR